MLEWHTLHFPVTCWMGTRLSISLLVLKEIQLLWFVSDLVEDMLGVAHNGEVTHTALQCTFHAHHQSCVFSYVY